MLRETRKKNVCFTGEAFLGAFPVVTERTLTLEITPENFTELFGAHLHYAARLLGMA